jgi:CYTH domain-containing protein
MSDQNMKVEIERKFLVARKKLPTLDAGKQIVQGYLARKPTIRVRVVTPQNGPCEGWITIKGKGSITRIEYEYPIPHEDAEQLLSMCSASLEKIRYEIEYGGWTWEVDRFIGAHDGLWLAEIELPSEATSFKRPPWVGEEVSTDPKYTNAALAERGSAP